MKIVLQLYGRLDVSEASDLIEMPSEGISSVEESFIACADETAAF